MPVHRILNRCTGSRMPFRWTINPYRGCEFGCVYCYARYTHEFLELRDPMDFERRIFVKRMAAEVLAHTLSRTPIGTDSIAIGTATDPYQPAERKYGLTRSMLQVFAQLSGLNISITTKSALVTRDLDLLLAINRRSRIQVNFSVITLNRRLQRILEPRAPRPGLRLRALNTLARAGIRCNILMMPMIPGLTDDPAAIESVIRMARKAGAEGVWWRTLFLMRRRRAGLSHLSARIFRNSQRESTHSMGTRRMRRKPTTIGCARSSTACGAATAFRLRMRTSLTRKSRRSRRRSGSSILRCG